MCRYNFGNNEFKAVKALYPRGHHYPFTKQISILSQTLPIVAAFDYVNPSGDSIHFAQFNIEEPPNSNASQYLQTSSVKLRVRVDSSGLISIVSASVSYEKVEPAPEEEPMDQSNSTNENVQKMEVDENAEKTANPANPATAAAEEPKRKSKPKTVSIELAVNPVFILGKTPKDVLQRFIEMEQNLILADKNWKEKADARNALEEFIYEWRNRLDSGGYDAFVNPKSKEEFLAKLGENESWLFEQEDQDVIHSKSVYDEKTNDMSSTFANSIMYRKREFENRPRLLEQFGHRVQMALKLTENTESEEEEELKKFVADIEAKQKWFDEVSGQFSTMSTYDDPPVKCDDIGKQINELDSSIMKIQNSRKKRADDRRKAAEAEAKKKAEEESKQAESAGDNPTTETSEPTKMEVDEQQVPTEAKA